MAKSNPNCNPNCNPNAVFATKRTQSLPYSTLSKCPISTATQNGI